MMLVVISPAKKLNENSDVSLIPKFSLPSRLDNSKKIVSTLRKYSSKSLGK